MINIKAKIKLFEGENKRQTHFYTGYRPLFCFVKKSKTSGQITLIDRKIFKPGEVGIVEITFLNKQFLGNNLGKGTSFKFYESEEPLGEGEILGVL